MSSLLDFLEPAARELIEMLGKHNGKLIGVVRTDAAGWPELERFAIATRSADRVEVSLTPLGRELAGLDPLPQLPAITISTPTEHQATAIVPRSGPGSWAIAHRIAAEVCQQLEERGYPGGQGGGLPQISTGRQHTCLIVRMATNCQASTIAFAEMFEIAAAKVARDELTMATHRVVRVPL